jgi:hypothetical protein
MFASQHKIERMGGGHNSPFVGVWRVDPHYEGAIAPVQR